MRILVTGACGFVGSTLVRTWAQGGAHEVVALDNLVRPGSETNRLALKRLGVRVFHADVRCPSDFDVLPKVDAVIEAAANPSVVAGVDGQMSSRQIVEHNLLGTVNALEFALRCSAAFVLLSTSRVYSIARLVEIPLRVSHQAFELSVNHSHPVGVTANGVSEGFSTEPPLSMYGATKLASEQLALEYGFSYDFPVWVNRCGVLAGEGQFGRADQGIFSYWIHSWLRRRPLRYTGFGGQGYQVRDCLHPVDLVPLIERQLGAADANLPRIVNVGGGLASALSLCQLSEWCRIRFGEHHVTPDPKTHQFDLPWVVLDATLARETWKWNPTRGATDILEGIAQHAETHPEWMDISE